MAGKLYQHLRTTEPNTRRLKWHSMACHILGIIGGSLMLENSRGALLGLLSAVYASAERNEVEFFDVGGWVAVMGTSLTSSKCGERVLGSGCHPAPCFLAKVYNESRVNRSPSSRRRLLLIGHTATSSAFCGRRSTSNIRM